MQVENYYGQQQDGSQHRFIDKVELTGKQILNDPRHFRFFEKDIRRSLTPVFPCAVLYTIEPKFIHIIAITYCARRPGYWKGCLTDD